jgi:hypothetical protein
MPDWWWKNLEFIADLYNEALKTGYKQGYEDGKAEILRLQYELALKDQMEKEKMH